MCGILVVCSCWIWLNWLYCWICVRLLCLWIWLSVCLILIVWSVVCSGLMRYGVFVWCMFLLMVICMKRLYVG